MKLVALIIMLALSGTYAIPADVTAFFRSGQVFITWTEDGSPTYDILRSTEPISSGNAASAVKLATVDNQTTNCGYGIGNAIGQTHWIITPKTEGEGLGTELVDDQGLFVHTTKENAGTFYYAVCSGGTRTISGNITEGITESRMPIRPNPIYRETSSEGRMNITYEFFMDYSMWNPAWEGYIFNFIVCLPQTWESGISFPVVNHIEGHGSRLGSVAGYRSSTMNIYIDNESVQYSGGLQDWYYGYKTAGGDSVANYTEYRIIKSIIFVIKELKGDRNRVFSYGHSMGASGTLTLASRYPAIFSAVYCSQPATDFLNPAFHWYSEVSQAFGTAAQNLPIINLPYDEPGYEELNTRLQKYNGTSVVEWQNTGLQLSKRARDDMPLLCVSHGTSDASIDWTTQGAPFKPLILASRRAFKYVVDGSSHGWQSWDAVNWSQMSYGRGLYDGYKFELDKSMPGFSGINASSTQGNYLVNAQWTEVCDSAEKWEMTISGVGETCNITPRRCKRFFANQGDRFNVYLNNTLVAQNVEADSFGLVTGTNINLTSTGTVRFENTFRTSAEMRPLKNDGAIDDMIRAVPNPFNPEIRISIAAPAADIRIYDMNGRTVMRQNSHTLIWNAEHRPSGTFIVRTIVNGKTYSKKIILLK